MKKFIINQESRREIEENGIKHTLHRIVANKDFSLIDGELIFEGDEGGFIEFEENLSQSGNCWVSENACVFGEAKVLNDAIVTGKALVSGNSVIKDSALVCDESKVCGNSKIEGNALVCCRSNIKDLNLKNNECCGK